MTVGRLDPVKSGAIADRDARKSRYQLRSSTQPARDAFHGPVGLGAVPRLVPDWKPQRRNPELGSRQLPRRPQHVIRAPFFQTPACAASAAASITDTLPTPARRSAKANALPLSPPPTITLFGRCLLCPAPNSADRARPAAAHCGHLHPDRSGGSWARAGVVSVGGQLYHPPRIECEGALMVQIAEQIPPRKRSRRPSAILSIPRRCRSPWSARPAGPTRGPAAASRTRVASSSATAGPMRRPLRARAQRLSLCPSRHQDRRFLRRGRGAPGLLPGDGSAGEGRDRRRARRRVRSHPAHGRRRAARDRRRSARSCAACTTTTPNGPARSGCAHFLPDEADDAARSAASRSSRCGGRSAIRSRPAAGDLRRAERRPPKPRGHRAPLSRPHRPDLRDHLQSGAPLVLVPAHAPRRGAGLQGLTTREKDGRARWTAHTAFDDPTTPPDARPRESIEIRTLAFF